ncbi:MAG: hypothetical protein GXO83_07670 [Chlorobi bacterium]|nr:hypothetical protein [Chlorobiota bacterium]
MVGPLYIPEMILISGTGQNCGKTTLAEAIIRFLSDKILVTGIKTSLHFHQLSSKTKILADHRPDYLIVRETDRKSGKDTARMLDAGSKDAYLILSTDTHMTEAFNCLYKQLRRNHVLVCESSVLARRLNPGLLFIMEPDHVKNKGKRTADASSEKEIILSFSKLIKERKSVERILRQWLKKGRLSFQVPF